MLAWILAIGAVACLAYFVVIVVYAGFGTAAAGIWLLLGGLLGAAAAGLKYYQKYPERVELWIPVSLVTLCASGLVILLVVQILIFGRIPATAEPGLDYLIVLGASVKSEGISKTLKLRLDKAAEYAAENPDTILVLSGAQGDGEPETEAAAMEKYLLGQGVPKEQMISEDRSHSTLENIVYSRILIEQDREEKKTQWQKKRPEMAFSAVRVADKPTRIGVLTSNFHLFRAKMIAQKQGMADVKGIASESDRVLFVHFCLRDTLAILKDRLMGNL